MFAIIAPTLPPTAKSALENLNLSLSSNPSKSCGEDSVSNDAATQEGKSSDGQDKSVPSPVPGLKDLKDNSEIEMGSNSDVDKAVLPVQPKYDPSPPLLPNGSKTSSTSVSLKDDKGEKKRRHSGVENSPDHKDSITKARRQSSGIVQPSTGKFAPRSKIKAP